MNTEMTIHSVIKELDQINETYQRYTGFNTKIATVKNRQRADENTITSVVKEKMRKYEKKRMSEIKAEIPLLDNELLIPVLHPPVLPCRPCSSNHLKAIILSASSGLLILAGILGIVVPILFAWLLPDFLYTLIGVCLLGGLIMWFLGGGSTVESYLKWQKEIIEYSKQMEAWDHEYSKMDLIKISDKLLAAVSKYEQEFLSIVKDCDTISSEFVVEMREEKNKLSKQHHAELEQLDQEWKEICNQLEAVTLIHPDLFYIAWRISSALKNGRASTLKEAINIAIDDERLEREEAARQAEARRQEAILQRQAEANRRHNEAVERTARDEARRSEQEARDQAYRARQEERDKERAAEARCLACVNRNKCSYTVKKNSLSCSAFIPK